MLKTEHRQISIDSDLARVRQVARRLLTEGVTNPVCEDAATLLRAERGPAPLVELFNRSHVKADHDKAWEPIREMLNELIRLCARISRHCKSLDARGDLAIDPLDEIEMANRFGYLAEELSTRLYPLA